ncbi:MAG: glycerophosphodiester phosphodiesterase [Myxococcota bacterium]
MDPVHPYFDVPHPIVIGHRGCAGERPENTLASFEHALAQGAALLESDVHVTRDGVPVLIHDDEVDRCTEKSGRVADFAWAELRELDAAFHFSPDGRDHPERGRGHRIPSLAEALARFPDARFNLELKEDRPGLVERTLDVVAEAGRAGTTLLTSGDDAIMQRLRRQVAERRLDVALGASTGEVAGFAVSTLRGEPPPAGPMALQIPAEFAGNPLVTPELLALAHAHRVQVHVWTINEPDEMARLLDLGVDGIVSDFPARMVELLARRT